jgi:hypothetical protein
MKIEEKGSYERPSKTPNLEGRGLARDQGRRPTPWPRMTESASVLFKRGQSDLSITDETTAKEAE